MKFETEQEKAAFEFVCELASELTSQRGCNDLSKENLIKFGRLLTYSVEPNGEKFLRKILYDFDIIDWLREQAKEGKWNQNKPAGIANTQRYGEV